MLGSGTICWSSKKQETLALSLVEVEYGGAVNETIQAVSMHGILTEFGIHTPLSVDIYFDNQSTLKIYSDLVQKQWIEHIEFHMHYICEIVHEKNSTLHYHSTEEKIADIFTKSFTKKRFVYLKSLLSVKA